MKVQMGAVKVHPNNSPVPVDMAKRRADIDQLLTGGLPLAVTNLYRAFCAQAGRRFYDRRAARQFFKKYDARRKS